MTLSVKQKGVLFLLDTTDWKTPSEGRARQGFLKTLYSLERRGYVVYLRAGQVHQGESIEQGGWVLTDKGREKARDLRKDNYIYDVVGKI